MMRRWILAVSVAATALAAVAVLGSAGAQTPTTTPEQRLITVNGGGAADLPSDADAAARRAAYRRALAEALDDAGAKAAFVAERTGLTLGAVHAVTEQSGSVLDGCVAFAVADGATHALPRKARPAKRPAKRPAVSKPTAAQTVPPAPEPAPYRCQAAASVTVSYAVAG